jgi:hypothetical protein
MAEKLFINNIGRPLQVQLLVRKGDDLFTDAAPVNFELGTGAGRDKYGSADNSRLVTYGNEVDIYLNGMSVNDDNGRQVLFKVLQRGVELDDQLNTNNTIEFIDRGGIGFNASNSLILGPEHGVATGTRAGLPRADGS